MKKIAASRPAYLVRVANPLVVDVSELLRRTPAYEGKVVGTLVYDPVQETCCLIVKGKTADQLCESGVDWYDLSPMTKVLEEDLRLTARKMQKYAKDLGLAPQSPESTVKHVAACMMDQRTEALLRHVGLTA